MPDNVHNRHRDYLAHHGIKGQKWGVRRYQNPDGTLTQAGKDHYRDKIEKASDRLKKRDRKLHVSDANTKAGQVYNARHKNFFDEREVFWRKVSTAPKNKELEKTYAEMDQFWEKYNKSPYAQTDYYEDEPEYNRLSKKIDKLILEERIESGKIAMAHADAFAKAQLKDLNFPTDRDFVEMYKELYLKHNPYDKDFKFLYQDIYLR